MTANDPTFADLQKSYQKMRANRLVELQKRFEQMTELRKRCDDELLVLADEIENFGVPAPQRRRSRFEKPECGTESGYQAHRRNGKTDCEPCRVAHRMHERIAATRRRLQKLAAS